MSRRIDLSVSHLLKAIVTALSLAILFYLAVIYMHIGLNPYTYSIFIILYIFITILSFSISIYPLTRIISLFEARIERALTYTFLGVNGLVFVSFYSISVFILVISLIVFTISFVLQVMYYSYRPIKTMGKTINRFGVVMILSHSFTVTYIADIPLLLLIKQYVVIASLSAIILFNLVMINYTLGNASNIGQNIVSSISGREEGYSNKFVIVRYDSVRDIMINLEYFNEVIASKIPYDARSILILSKPVGPLYKIIRYLIDTLMTTLEEGKLEKIEEVIYTTPRLMLSLRPIRKEIDGVEIVKKIVPSEPYLLYNLIKEFIERNIDSKSLIILNDLVDLSLLIGLEKTYNLVRDLTVLLYRGGGTIIAFMPKGIIEERAEKIYLGLADEIINI